jgi:hypothetical protein
MTPGTAAAQGLEPGSQNFIDSLLTASNAIADAGSVNVGTSKTSGRQGSNSSNLNASGASQNGRAVLLPNQPQRAAVAQRTSTPQQASSANAVVASTGRSAKGSFPSLNTTTGFGDVPVRNGASQRSSVILPALVPASVVKLAGTQSTLQAKLNSRVGDLLKAAWVVTGSKVQGIKASLIPSSMGTNQVSDTSLTSASSASQNVIQIAAPNVTANAKQNALQQVIAPSTSNAVANTSTSVATGSLQSNEQSVLSNVSPAATQTAAPAAASHQAQNTLPNAAQSPVTSSTPASSNEVLNAVQAARQSIPSNGLQFEAQAVASIAISEVLNTLPKAAVNAASDVTSTASSKVVTNTVQAAVLGAVSSAV